MAIIERNLAKQIEQVILEFLAESKASAAAAVEQTFLIAPHTARRSTPSATRVAGPRETATEIGAIRSVIGF